MTAAYCIECPWNIRTRDRLEIFFMNFATTLLPKKMSAKLDAHISKHEQQGGDLFDSIAEANKYSEKEASRMMNDLSNALSYLHSINICHRDIKPENLLVCDYSWMDTRVRESGNADGKSSLIENEKYSFKILKLADFGLAIELDPGDKLYDVCGTPNYVAPEILSESGYDHKVDVWAAGVIAYVLLCGFPPFVSPDNDQDELFDQILTGKFEFSSPAFDEISDQAKQLISHMLQVDPNERASAKQVHQHPWISVSVMLCCVSSEMVVGQDCYSRR